METIDIRFFIAFLAPTLGFVVWFVKRWMDDCRDERRRQHRHDNLVRALYAEIAFNTHDMEVFLERSPPASYLFEKLKADPDLVPHITDARHTEIYRNSIDELHVVADGMLHQAIYFYGLLEKIRAQIEGVNRPSYKTLSDEGRLGAVDVIRQTALNAAVCGRELLGTFEREYTALDLREFKRSGEAASWTDLRKRSTQLTERLHAAKSRLNSGT